MKKGKGGVENDEDDGVGDEEYEKEWGINNQKAAQGEEKTAEQKQSTTGRYQPILIRNN